MKKICKRCFHFKKREYFPNCMSQDPNKHTHCGGYSPNRFIYFIHKILGDYH